MRYKLYAGVSIENAFEQKETRCSECHEEPCVCDGGDEI